MRSPRWILFLVDEPSHRSASASAQELISGVYFYTPIYFLLSGIELLPTKSSFIVLLLTFSTRLCKDQASILGASLNSCKGLSSHHFFWSASFSNFFFLFHLIVVLYTETLNCYFSTHGQHEKFSYEVTGKAKGTGWFLFNDLAEPQWRLGGLLQSEKSVIYCLLFSLIKAGRKGLLSPGTLFLTELPLLRLSLNPPGSCTSESLEWAALGLPGKRRGWLCCSSIGIS